MKMHKYLITVDKKASQTKFTLGTWEEIKSATSTAIVAKDKHICNVSCFSENGIDNAALICAAPELYAGSFGDAELIEYIAQRLVAHEEPGLRLMCLKQSSLIRERLAKARGEGSK